MATTSPDISRLSVKDGDEQSTDKLLALKNGQDTKERTFPPWDAEDPYDPCKMCGWTPFKHHWNSKDFASSIQVLNGGHGRGTWTLGNKYIIKERDQEMPNNEVANAKFVRDNTTIPVPAVPLSWSDGDKDFIMQERVYAVMIDDHYEHMSEEQRQDVAKDFAACMTQMRKLKSDKMQTVAGGPVSFSREVAFGPSNSAEEMFKFLIRPEHGYKNLPAEEAEILRKHMPPVEPFTFTHMDIEPVNILVRRENGKLKALIDWEFGAYFPVWWEYAKFLQNAFEGDDEDFRRMVVVYLPEEDRYEKAVLWVTAYLQLHDNWRLHGPEDGQETLKKLIEYDDEQAKKKSSA